MFNYMKYGTYDLKCSMLHDPEQIWCFHWLIYNLFLFFLCRTYMDMTSQATNEWMNEWYLEHAQSSKQEDDSSCGVYVSMVNAVACCDATFLSLDLVQELVNCALHVAMFAWGELWMRTVQNLNFFKCIQAAISPHTHLSMDFWPRPKCCNEQAFSKQCPIVSCVFFLLKNMFTSCILFCMFNIYWGSALSVKVFVILCREVIKFVSVYCFHMQAHIMVLLRRMQKQLWNIAHQLVTQVPMWNSFVSGCFIPLWRLLKWITVKFLTYIIASTRVALTGCNVTPA